MLQGPAGPFFRRVAAQLEARGANVTKVNFNAADGLFFGRGDVVTFRGHLDAWPDFFANLVRKREIDAVVLFGDMRPRHRMAIETAEALGVRVFVFEEGYLRPDFVTLEEGGVSKRSSMPRDPDFYRQLEPDKLPPPKPVGNVMARAAVYAIAYACTHGLTSWRYPHYEHHRCIRPFHQALHWSRGSLRRVRNARRDRPIDARISSGEMPPFFVVPLQVHLDAALHDCPFESVDEFITTVVESFARNAPSAAALLVKDHPLGRPYRDYSRLLEDLRQRHGLADRLRYVDVIHLPTALRNARGTVTINSTVGLSSIHHGTPVKCLGDAVYDMPGLTFQGALDDFWTQPGVVDDDLYRKFHWWLRKNRQVNGSVWRKLWP